jgi:plasmid maintenance system antidote protein VapI
MAKSKTVSEVIRDALRSSDESLRQIGARADVDVGRLSRFVRGQRRLTTDAVDRLCKALGLQLVSSKRKKRPK